MKIDLIIRSRLDPQQDVYIRGTAMRNLIVLFLFCPLILFASRSYSAEPTGETKSSSILLKSSSNKTNALGKKFVNDLWTLIVKGKLHTLKERMKKDFKAVGLDGSLLNRSAMLNAIHTLHKQGLRIRCIDEVIALSFGDKLIVYYAVPVKIDDEYIPVAQETIFQKQDGKWKWQEQADAIIIPPSSKAKVQTKFGQAPYKTGSTAASNLVVRLIAAQAAARQNLEESGLASAMNEASR